MGRWQFEKLPHYSPSTELHEGCSYRSGANPPWGCRPVKASDIALPGSDGVGVSHLHERRMEAYVYFGLSPEDRVMHFLGTPTETRHLVVASGDAVLSPGWSIHMGAGTGPYAFVWGMTGENQVYQDVDPVPVKELR